MLYVAVKDSVMLSLSTIGAAKPVVLTWKAQLGWQELDLRRP